MRKVKLSVKIIAGAVIATTAIAAGNIYKTNAVKQKNISDKTIQLNVEKQDRDTIKIYLSNFGDLAKSLQLSVKIDEGNVNFVENSIKWLMSNDENNIITDYKIDNSKKVLDLFIVSKEPINTDGGVIELCEIDVSKDESILDKILKTKDFSYKVVPNVIDGEAYSYVRYSTNKRIGGEDIINADEDKLVISNEPIIKLKDNQYVINNKIVIEKGTNFVIGNYLEAFDVDGNEIEDIEYSGNIDTDNEGSYNIECTATDSNGNKSTLKVTVEVKDSINIDNSKPDDSNTDDSNNEKPLDILDIINEDVLKIVSGDGTSSAPIMVETLENTSTAGFAEFLANLSEFKIEDSSYEEHGDYKIVNLKLANKKVRETKSDDNNSGYKHLRIKVYNTNTDLINLLNNFIVQNNIKEVEVSDNTNNPSKPGGSSGSSGSSKPSHSKDEATNDTNDSEENNENITEDSNDSGENIENNDDLVSGSEGTSNDDYVNGGSNSINNNSNNTVVNSNSVSGNDNNHSNNNGVTNNASNSSNNSKVERNNSNIMQEYSSLEQSTNDEKNNISNDKKEEVSEYRNDENLANENEEVNEEASNQSESKLTLNKRITFGFIIATIVAGVVWLLLHSNKRTR